jgi:hypothetical protein
VLRSAQATVELVHMLTLTLDMNCLIDIDSAEPRKGTPHVRALIEKSERGVVDLAICASCASERQSDGSSLENFSQFQERLKRAGLSHLTLLKPLLRWDVSFFDYSIIAGPELSAQEDEIFRTLFPGSNPSWSETADLCGERVEDTSSAAFSKWRNKICDAQAFWSHEHNRRDVFVTSDGNFAKRFPDRRILTPEQASAIIA